MSREEAGCRQRGLLPLLTDQIGADAERFGGKGVRRAP